MSRIITPHELGSRTASELSALFCKVSKELAVTNKSEEARRNCLASLENINRERNSRYAKRFKPPGF